MTNNTIESPSPVTSTPPKSALRKRGRKLAGERATIPVDRELERERAHEHKAKRARWRNGEDIMVGDLDIHAVQIEDKRDGADWYAVFNPVVGVLPKDLDIRTIPHEYKREGSDWYVVFNPKVKRVLDVQLVHTLMHERCVFRPFL